MIRSLLSFMTGMFLLFAFAVSRVGADEPPGATLFSANCAACHGATGRGGSAPAIGSEAYLAATDDATIAGLMSEGAVSKGMPAWGKANSGTLSDDQIASLVAYLHWLASTPDATAPTTPPANAPAAVPAPTKVTLTQATNQFGETVLSATLQDANGNPVKAAAIAFSRPTTWGVVELGGAKTDAQGTARWLLPVVPVNAREVEARFKGDKGLDGSAGKLVVEPARLPAPASRGTGSARVYVTVGEPVPPPEGSLITPNPPLLPTVLFTLVVGSVWATYAHILSLMNRIRGGAKPVGAGFVERKGEMP